MANLRVYLVGGIQGMTYKECVDWREKVSLELEFHNIEPLSPMRGKAFLKKEISIHDSYEQHKFDY